MGLLKLPSLSTKGLTKAGLPPSLSGGWDASYRSPLVIVEKLGSKREDDSWTVYNYKAWKPGKPDLSFYTRNFSP